MRAQSADKAARSAARFRSDWPGSARAIAQGMFARPEGGKAMSAAQAEARIRAQDPEAMAQFWDSLISADARGSIPAPGVPMLAIHGALSRVYPPASATWIAANASDGRALVLPGCGHAPLLEDPDAVARAITDFVRQT